MGTISSITKPIANSIGISTTNDVGAAAGTNTTEGAGTGATSNFGDLLKSFQSMGEQSLQNQVAMENAQLQVNQEQQIAQQQAKTVQGGIDKMDVK